MEFGGKDVIVILSSSESGSLGDSECRRLSDEVRSLMVELRHKMPAGGPSEVGSDPGID